jgi:hypothetical protein
MGNFTVPSLLLCVSLLFSGNICIAQLPVILGQFTNPHPIDEDQTLTINSSDLNILLGGAFEPLTVLVSPGENYTVTDGTIVTPDPEFEGPLTAQLVVSDGLLTSLPYNYNIIVNGVNDGPPIITGQNTVPTVNEGESLEILVTWLDITDPDAGDIHTLTVLPNPGEYTFSGNTVTPIAPFEEELTVLVQVSDGTDTSPQFSFDVDVILANTAPVIASQNTVPTVNVPIRRRTVRVLRSSMAVARFDPS